MTDTVKKQKRTRRTKVQIEADKAAELATKPTEEQLDLPVDEILGVSADVVINDNAVVVDEVATNAEHLEGVSDLDLRIAALKAEGKLVDQDYFVKEYPHGYIDVYTWRNVDKWEFRPNGSEILRNHQGVEVVK